MRARTVVCLLAIVVMALPTAGLADKPEKRAWNSARDFRSAGEVVQRGQLPVSRTAKNLGLRTLGRGRDRVRTLIDSPPPSVGSDALWLGLDDVAGQYVPKLFTLRVIGQHAEVWVARDLDFPDGDCRNGQRTQLTDAQVSYLLGEFDTNIYPKESSTFSVAPERDGSGEVLSDFLDEDLAELVNPNGPGDRTVILVDNVRDESFYDLDNSTGSSYIAGFFSDQLNEAFDRNIMTIDGFDWLHRTGANPPDEPVPGNFCTSAPARPFLYEGVFAHEYQHLLESYEDPDEAAWIDEGLADWAQTLTGYVNPRLSIADRGFDSHIQCFLGYLGVATPVNPNPDTDPTGPENSLTRWSDQGDAEILCDYGAAYSLMEFVSGRYGKSFMSALHRGDENGLAGLQQVLSQLPGRKGRKAKAADVLHDWSLMVALDGMIDRGSRITGRPKESRVTTPTLDASINWDAPGAYASPGAPPNGADYVRLRRADGSYLAGGDIDSIGFAGARTLPTAPVQWAVDPNPPGQPGDTALASRAGNDRDEAIIRKVAVPSEAQAQLRFNAFWNEEETWDYAFVQVSADGGATYESVACTDTGTAPDPDAHPTVSDNAPGFTGYSAGWRPQVCSLARYAGQTVLLAFRAFNDPAFLGNDIPGVAPGFWVDDIVIGSTVVTDGSSLTGWKSATETRPNPVAGYTVYIVSFRSAGRERITVRQLRLTGDFDLRGKGRIQRYVDRRADIVGAVVIYDDPTETSGQYAPYRLVVNGVTQPGGGL
jgi:hypothetical protein